jgi:hypothetical protein
MNTATSYDLAARCTCGNRVGITFGEFIEPAATVAAIVRDRCGHDDRSAA